MTRYGYQDMPDDYSDVNPDKEEPPTRYPYTDQEQAICDECKGCSGGEPVVCPLDDGQGEWGHD